MANSYQVLNFFQSQISRGNETR